MTLLEKINNTHITEPREYREHFKLDDFFFEIREAQVNNKIDYDRLLSIFKLVHESLSDLDYDVFRERLMLKLAYLHLGYGLPLEIVRVIPFVEPVILLDMKLDKEFLAEDDMFSYIKEAYKEYKQEMNFNVKTFLSVFQDMDLSAVGAKLEETVKNLQTTIGSE